MKWKRAWELVRSYCDCRERKVTARESERIGVVIMVCVAKGCRGHGDEERTWNQIRVVKVSERRVNVDCGREAAVCVL